MLLGEWGCEQVGFLDLFFFVWVQFEFCGYDLVIFYNVCWLGVVHLCMVEGLIDVREVVKSSV